MKARPTTDGRSGSRVTTPNAATMIQLLGAGVTAGSVALTRDEFAAVKKLYGFELEGPQEKPGVRAFAQAGADRNAIRHAEADGLRLLAWIAKFAPVGEDPIKTVVQMAVAAGFDVDPEDVEWAEDAAEDLEAAE